MKRLDVYMRLSSMFNLPAYDHKDKGIAQQELDYMMFPHTEKLNHVWAEQYVSEFVAYICMHPVHRVYVTDGYSDGAMHKGSMLLLNIARTLMYDKEFDINFIIKRMADKNELDNQYLTYAKEEGNSTREVIVLDKAGDWQSIFTEKYPGLKHQQAPGSPETPVVPEGATIN